MARTWTRRQARAMANGQGWEESELYRSSWRRSFALERREREARRDARRQLETVEVLRARV